MTLTNTAVEWAVQFVADHSDGDLFPRVVEIKAILDGKIEFAAEILSKSLTQHRPGANRRFLVPKDEVSYRQATQLDPQDSIILTALIFQYGSMIEARRRSTSEVISYRFSPSAQDGLYKSHTSWNDFWTTAITKAENAGCVLYCDIADFYNQIYHHTVENQLIESGLSNQAAKWMISLLESTTVGVSRGIPIGPHAAHLLAEASLIPIDNSMASSGLAFLRYADDIVVFCATERDAKLALGRLASILDRHQRLMLQKHKTRFFTPSEFKTYCAQMIEDRPINSEEDSVLKLVRKYSGGSPYIAISYGDISAGDWSKITDTLVSKIIEEYIAKENVDFIRLRWFYRRLTQIGHPGAIDVTLSNIDRLTPCFASICTYFASLQSISSERWLEIGGKLFDLLAQDETRDSEYFRLSILSLFSRNPHINHFEKLARLYAGSDPFAKREILLAAKASGAIDWIKEYKEDYAGMDGWQKMAFLYCCHDFPADERKYFINRWTFERAFESVLAKWAKLGT